MALTDNLSAFFEFESFALTTDATANALTLTNSNTVTSVTGKVGNAAHFVRASSQTLYHSSTALLQPGPDCTFVAWVKLTTLPSVAGGSMGVFLKVDFIQSSWGIYAPTSDQFTVYISDSSENAQTASSTLSLSTGVWYFVVGWYDSADKKGRVQVNNGTVFTTAALGGAGIRTTGNAEFSFGRFSDGSRFLNGDIDQGGFWQRVLSSSELTQLYNSGNGLSYAQMQPATAMGPISMHHRRLRAA